MTILFSNCCEQPIFVQYGEEGTNFYICSKCHKACDEKIENNPSQYIDPVAQVFMDFYANLMEPNDDGETRMIDYAYWAKQVRMVLIVDCACHESWREGITHSKYECYGKDIRILRAELAEKARKETEEELFKFEPEN